jgi:aspartate kinase
MSVTRVHKYGGSSVADVGRIKQVAEKVAAARATGARLCVVVSAMGDTTDELLALARQASASPPRRELDMLLTAGERISMALLSMALDAIGVPAVSFTGSQSGIITTGDHAAARILEVKPARVEEALAAGKVAIVAGYQGVSRGREVTTLGRGGSDTTAVALAAALGADCEIYSDVAGVFTADPRVVPDARRLDRLSYDEMQELAAAGARVLNAQAVEFARERGIAIRARSTFGSSAETVVAGPPEGAERVAGVASRHGLALASFPAAALSRALEVLAARGAFASDVVRVGDGTLVALPLDDVHGLPALLEELRRETAGAARVEADGVGSVSIVGTGLSAGNRAVREISAALAELSARPRAIVAGALRVTAFCDAAALLAAVRRLHARLVGGSGEPPAA